MSMVLKADVAIVGSGAGGAALANELAGRGVRKVLLVERGAIPRPEDMGTLRSAILGYYDRCALRTSKEGLVVYRALIAGGTTVVSCGNGVRVLEDELRRLGIGLEKELSETEKDLSINPVPDHFIGTGSRMIMDAANRLGYEMGPMPKYVNFDKCNACGLCVLGCRRGAKWSSLDHIKSARRKGVKFLKKVDVRSVVISGGRAIGLTAKSPKGNVRIFADNIVLAAGGIGTPVILQRSGIAEAGQKFFADIFNVTYGVVRGQAVNLINEPSMAVVSTKFMDEKGFLISPFIDMPLVLRWAIMSKRKQLKGFKYNNLLGIMVKTRDDSTGKITDKERFEKTPSPEDRKRLNEGARMAALILKKAGVDAGDIIYTKPRAAHPGGSAAIGEVVDRDLRTRVSNLYVCDASVLPRSPGAPPIVTIIALAKRLAKHISGNG